MLWFQHLAAEFERVLAGRMREFVDETLAIERIVIGVHAAPETWPDMRVAHRVLDQQVRYLVAELAFRSGCVQALEGSRVHAVL